MSAGTQLLFRDDAYQDQHARDGDRRRRQQDPARPDAVLSDRRWPARRPRHADRCRRPDLCRGRYAQGRNYRTASCICWPRAPMLQRVGSDVTAAIDWDYRHRLMRMHTCMHLLCAVVPGSVTGGPDLRRQGAARFRRAGRQPGQGRDHGQAQRPDRRRPRGRDALDHRRGTGGKPELVRTMSVKPPTGAGRIRLLDIVGVDLQPCGGTHIRTPPRSGPIVRDQIENKGRQNRRIAIAFAG